MDLSRRQFALGGLAAFAFRDDTLKLVRSISKEPGGPDDEAYWTELRKAFYIPSELTVFNHVGLAPPPKAAIDAQDREVRRAAADPSYFIWRKQDRELETVRSDLAALVGCQKEELAITMNATYGLQTVIMGIPMQPGDEIVSTSHDYSRVHTAIDQRVSRDKAVSKMVELGPQALYPSALEEKILAEVTSKTKLVVLSRISFLIGQIQPLEKITAKLRERDIPLLLDTAQSIGLLDDKLDDLGSPIQVACLHKWMMGPIGTGIMAVKPPMIERIWPLHPAPENIKSLITKFEQVGTRPAAPLLAIKESLELHYRLTAAAKRARLVYLRKRLADKILNIPGAAHYGSLDPAICLPMLTVGFSKITPEKLSGQLMEKHKMHVTTATRGGVEGIRISPNVFTTVGEIDRLADAIIDLTK